MILVLNNSKINELDIAIGSGSRIKYSKTLRSKNKRLDLIKHIDIFLKSNKVSTRKIKAIIVFQGPGSFSGLRNIISIANTWAYVMNIPAVGVKSLGEGIEDIYRMGLQKLKKQKSFKIILPHYGKPANITKSNKKLL